MRIFGRVSLSNRTGNFGRENREAISQNKEVIRLNDPSVAVVTLPL